MVNIRPNYKLIIKEELCLIGKRQKGVADIETAASSKAINKTIAELDALHGGDRISADRPLREKLHDKLFDLLRSEAKSWYKRGFKRGHQTSYEEGEKVPTIITRRMIIKASYLSKKGELVILKSDIKQGNEKLKLKLKGLIKASRGTRD